jgi:SAM-dependent methyltransferase
MHSYTCTSKEQYQALLGSGAFAARYRFLCHLAETFRRQTSFAIPGVCEVCDRAVDFLTDHQCGMRIEHGWPWPNWRERQVCPSCGLASRQRMAFGFIQEMVKRSGRAQGFSLYMMEMVTPIFDRARAAFPDIDLIGSEYFGPGFKGGSPVRGIRHEDVHQLSLADESVDLVVSNDVMEHVPDPGRGFRETFRVLRCGGTLFLTIPFHSGNDTTTVRAEVREGAVIHHLPEVYHGNPVSEKGSLVFTDFGWDVLSMLRAAGFGRVDVQVIWSYLYGHLGIPMEYFRATKP